MASIHAVSSRLTQLLNEVPGLATGPVDENKQTTDILVVVDESLAAQDLKNVSRAFSDDRINVVFTYIADLNKDAKPSSYYAIFSGVVGIGVPYDLDLFSTYTTLLIPGGVLVVKTETGTEDELVKVMKTCGLLRVTMSNIQGIVYGHTPSYKVGYSDKITFNSAEAKDCVVSAWKLDDNNVEMISEDDLLEADDLEKPASSSLRVCATTKKAKACKDCSCGLAEELEANRHEGASNTDKTPTVKSSCGSCYLGDAFRCSTCPYLGMPAFKPGEKVKLAGNLLQDDF